MLEPITEQDSDRDHAGDSSEDRTNLRASATTQRLSGYRRAFDITVENAGPRTADLPKLRASLSGARARVPGARPVSVRPARSSRAAMTTRAISSVRSRRGPSVSRVNGVPRRPTPRVRRRVLCSRAAQGRDLAGGDGTRTWRSAARDRRCRSRSMPARNPSPTASPPKCAPPGRAPCACSCAAAARPTRARSRSARGHAHRAPGPATPGPRAGCRDAHGPLGTATARARLQPIY